jgi:hypothetical protein
MIKSRLERGPRTDLPEEPEMKTAFALLFTLGVLAAPALAKDENNELAACRQDMEKYCRNVEPGEGRQMKCMYELRDKLAPACAGLVREKYERFLELRRKKEGR